jgi:FkbM family methyltransferase
MRRLVYGCIMRVRPAFVGAFLKRLLRVRREMFETRLGRYYIDPVSQFGHTLIRQGVYEPAMVKTLETSLRSGGVFVDLGANEGYFTVLAAKMMGPEGRVVAIEPQTRLQEVLRRNLKENGVERIVEVSEFAISDEEGSATFYLTPDVNCGSSGLAQTTRYKNPTESVKTTTLAKLLAAKKIGRVDLLKIDIEGYEYEAVLGSKEVFLNKIPKRIALELHPELLAERGKSANGLTAFIQGCGYKRVPNLDNLVFELAR